MTEHDSAPGVEPRIVIERTSPRRAAVRIMAGLSCVASDTCDPATATSRSRCIATLTLAAPNWIGGGDWMIRPHEVEAAIINAPVIVAESKSADERAGSGGAITYETVEAWPEPVDGAALFDALAATITRFVTLSVAAAYACALWSVHTWCYRLAVHTPRLVVGSPTMRCGKTTLLRVLAALAHRPESIDNCTSAVIYRLIAAHSSTLLLDETDRWLRDPETEGVIIGVINSGHRRGGTVMRTVGEDYDVRRFSTHSPMALAGIGSLAATIQDRAIVIPLERRAPGVRGPRLDDDRLFLDVAPLRRRIARWVADHGDEIGSADPALPEELGDRARDNWRLLCVIADVAGGAWPARARAAAMSLSAVTVDPESEDVGVRLLADLRELFVARGVDRLTSDEILRDLIEREDRPWPEWKRGRPLSPKGLAGLLTRFRVAPRALRMPGGLVLRGYLAEDLAEPWTRYLPAGPPVIAVTPLQPAPQADPRPNGPATPTDAVADAIALRSAPQAGRSGVAATDPPSTAEEDAAL